MVGWFGTNLVSKNRGGQPIVRRKLAEAAKAGSEHSSLLSARFCRWAKAPPVPEGNRLDRTPSKNLFSYLHHYAGFRKINCGQSIGLHDEVNLKVGHTVGRDVTQNGFGSRNVKSQLIKKQNLNLRL